MIGGGRAGWPAAAILAALTALGCSTETADDLPLRTLVLERSLLIDGYEHDLVPIGWIVVSRGGEMFISQPQLGSILAFGPDGERLVAVGRTGDGPGEFQAMSTAGLVGDTLWVLDRRLGRMSFISPAREVARTERWITGEGATLTTATGTTRYISVTPSAVYTDGSVHAMLESEDALQLPLPEDFPIPHGIVGPDRVVRRIVAEYPFGRSRFQIVHGGGELHTTAPFPLLPSYATSQDGHSTALAEVAVDGADAGTIRVTRFDALGDTVYARRYPFVAVPIPAAVADSAIRVRADQIEEFVPGLGGAYRGRAWVPPVYPPVEGLVSGRDGSVWIRWRTTPERGSHYLVLDPRGDPAGEVFLPRNVQIRVADLGQIWTLITDDLDVQSIARYEVSGLE